MSYLTPPVNLTGSPITFRNPGTGGSNAPAVAVQVRNASGSVLTVNQLTGQAMIDPFTATTVPIALDQDIIVIPSFVAFGVSGYVSAEWLLAGESPSEPDGPLTGPATIAGAISQVYAAAILGNTTLNPAPLGGQASTAQIACANYQSVIVNLTPGTANLPWVFGIEFQDSLGNVLQTISGHRGPSTGPPPFANESSIPIAVQGSQIQVFVSNNSASAVSVQVEIIGVPTGSAAAPLIQPEVMISNQLLTLTPGQTTNYYPSIYIPGKYQVWMDTQFNQFFYGLQRWNGSAWEFQNQVSFGPTGVGIDFVDQQRLWLITPDEWRIQAMNNNTGNVTFFATVTGPFT